jgi:hypothetical protein
MWKISGSSYVVTSELLAVSVSLGVMATLFAAASLHDEQARRVLLGRRITTIGGALHTYNDYCIARENLTRLTGLKVPMRADASPPLSRTKRAV